MELRRSRWVMVNLGVVEPLQRQLRRSRHQDPGEELQDFDNESSWDNSSSSTSEINSSTWDCLNEQLRN